MKRSFNLLLIFAVVACVLSCNKTKSYTEYLKDERKAIDRLFDKNGFVKVKNFSEALKENHFIQLENGVYLNVIDSGNGVRPVARQTILFRFKANFFMTDTLIFDYFSGSVQPLEFSYGNSVGNDQYFSSTGVASIMDYLGDSAVVKLIVPFTVGSSYQGNNYEPVYFERLRYTFQK